MRRPILLGLALCALGATADRPPVKCSADSPERRGEEGCTILASRPLHASPATRVYWHLDRFDSLAAAQQAAGPDGVAADAHGSTWLLTVEPRSGSHHGGHHVAWIGPLALPAAAALTMRVQSSLLLPGATTPVHTHSGTEVFYVVGGEQCLETAQTAHRLRAQQSLVLPAEVVHRGRVIGSDARRAFGLIIHDAAQPASRDLPAAPALRACRSPGPPTE